MGFENELSHFQFFLQYCIICLIMFRKRHYFSSRWKESRRFADFEISSDTQPESFIKALQELSHEDEELPLPSELGPVVFRDGIFQIDMEPSGKTVSLDPALKGLIDSILGS